MKVVCILSVLALCHLLVSRSLHAQVLEPQRQAFEDAKVGAEKGNAVAQHSLAESYLQGRGTTKNEGEALKWFRKAADQNHLPAQFSLGTMFEQGLGVRKNFIEAYYWYRRAA